MRVGLRMPREDTGDFRQIDGARRDEGREKARQELDARPVPR